MARSNITKKIAPPDMVERAYMMGLCATDIFVRRLGEQIEVIVGSTRQEILEIFEEVFGKYTKVNSTDTIDKKTGLPMSYRYAILDPSFEFLLSSKKSVPENEEELYAYIAGAIDGDGNIRFRKRIKTGEGEIRILNTDKTWLEKMRCKLLKYNYHPCVHKNGAEFALSIYRKRDIIRLGRKVINYMKNKTRKQKLQELLGNMQVIRKPYRREAVDKDRLVEYLRQGLTLNELAKKLGVHRTTIKYWLKKWSIRGTNDCGQKHIMLHS